MSEGSPPSGWLVPRQWRAKLVNYGPLGFGVYCSVHYLLWVVLFLALYATGLDLRPAIVAAGFEWVLDALPQGAGIYVSAYAGAFTLNKALVPLKVGAAVVLTPKARIAVDAWRGPKDAAPTVCDPVAVTSGIKTE